MRTSSDEASFQTMPGWSTSPVIAWLPHCWMHVFKDGGLVSLASLATAVMLDSVPWTLGLVLRECSALAIAPRLARELQVSPSFAT